MVSSEPACETTFCIAAVIFASVALAFVRMSEGVMIDTGAVKQVLRDKLPGYKVPVRIFNWPEDSSQPGIKPDRRYLISLAEKMSDQV